MFTCEVWENVVCDSGEWGGVMRGFPMTMPASFEGDQDAFAASTSICTSARAVRTGAWVCSMASGVDGLGEASSVLWLSSREGESSWASEGGE